MPTTDKVNPDSKNQVAELRNDTSVAATTATGKSTTSRKSKFRMFIFAALLLAMVAVVAAYFSGWTILICQQSSSRDIRNSRLDKPLKLE